MDSEINIREFIEEQFQKHGIFFTLRENDFSMYCPYGNHEGNTLLMQVCFDGLKIHCWGCGQGGTYNTLAERLSLKKLPREALNGYNALDMQLASVTMEPGLPALPKGIETFAEEYRGLSPEFLSKFDTKKWYDPDSCGWRILWPVTHNHKLQGYTAGRLHPDLNPKYRHGPEGVIRTRRSLFPIDYPLIRDVVVLVEGPFSALRLISEGIPAVAVLGAGNWHSAKITMLQQRKHPVRGLIVAFDPDKSGEKGAENVEATTRDVFEEVEIFDCPRQYKKEIDADGNKVYVYKTKRDGDLRLDADGNPIKVIIKFDPGDMPAKYVEKLRAQYLAMCDRLKPVKKAKKS